LKKCTLPIGRREKENLVFVLPEGATIEDPSGRPGAD
jgi:hypothetical protein